MSALTHKILAKLEAQARGKLSAEETQKLEEELDQLPGGTEAAADYRRLWAGFDALQGEEQRNKMAAWEEEWSTTNDAELAEWYVAGELSIENQELAQKRQGEDPLFAELLAQQQELLAGFGALKGEQFRQQMDQWNQSQTDGETKVRSLSTNWRRYVAAAAAVLLLVVAGMYWNIQNNYSDTALAGKYYKVPPTGNTMGVGEMDETTYLDAFTEAHRAMQATDYDRARLLFERLSTEVPPANFSDDDLQYYQDNLDWNLILALLGQEESSTAVQQRLEVILASPEHTYLEEAQRLQEDLNKFWR